MEIEDLQEEFKLFLEEQKWLEFTPSEVFTHLIEELGELAKHILFRTGYKTESIGHRKTPSEELKKEFGDIFSLFLHLCILFDINLEEIWADYFPSLKKRFDAKTK